MNSFVRQLRKGLARAVAIVGDLALFFGIVLVGGFGSSWYAVQAGSGFMTRAAGPWVAWTSAARADADPYTRAHFARTGSLPLTSEVATTYWARTDQSGRKLASGCEYAIEGTDIPANWWSLALFDENGWLISNTLNRHSYTSETIALRADGTYLVSLARDLRAGNWIPSGRSGRVALMLTIVEPLVSTEDLAADAAALKLPTVRLVDCG